MLAVCPAEHIAQYPGGIAIISILQLGKLRLRDFKYFFIYRLKLVLGWCHLEVDSSKISIQVPVEESEKVNMEAATGTQSCEATLRASRSIPRDIGELEYLCTFSYQPFFEAKGTWEGC